MKKAMFSAISLAVFGGSFCIATAAGQLQPSGSSLFNQVRIGFGLAGEYINGGANLKIEPTGPGNLGQIQSDQSQVGKRLQLAPCIDIGAIIAKDYYLGLHMSWHFSSLRNKSNNPISNNYKFVHEFKLNNYADILIKSGYKITPCSMIYGLIGPSIAKWSDTTSEFGRVNLVDEFQTSRKSVGVGIGLGFEYLFRKKYAFSLDYTHHFYRPVTKTQRIMYWEPRVGYPAPGFPRSGDINKIVQPSFGVFAIRFTKFFNL